jgi:hypothetical protein
MASQSVGLWTEEHEGDAKTEGQWSVFVLLVILMIV